MTKRGPSNHEYECSNVFCLQQGRTRYVFAAAGQGVRLAGYKDQLGGHGALVGGSNDEYCYDPEMVKQGSDCPTGFYSAGDYCKQLTGSDRKAMPRMKDGKCPSGWYRSGDYCVR